MKKAIIYVHGKGGNATEADYYQKFFPDYDISGVNYTEYLPWIVREQIRNTYDRLKDRYDEISLITDMMCWTGVSEAELQEKKEISTDFGETLLDEWMKKELKK